MRTLVLSLLLLAPAGAATFTFDTLAVDVPIPFSLTDAGLTADFSSPSGPVFSISDSFFSTLTGRLLIDADEPFHALHIVFSQPLSNVSLRFALNGSEADTFLLEAFSGGLGGASRGSATASGTTPPGFVFPEGVISLTNAAGFDTIRLTSSAGDFAIDDVNATAAVPEPFTAALMSGGLALLAIRRRKSRA